MFYSAGYTNTVVLLVTVLHTESHTKQSRRTLLFIFVDSSNWIEKKTMKFHKFYNWIFNIFSNVSNSANNVKIYLRTSKNLSPDHQLGTSAQKDLCWSLNVEHNFRRSSVAFSPNYHQYDSPNEFLIIKQRSLFEFDSSGDIFKIVCNWH